MEHTINGKKMPALVDNNELIEREKKAKSDMDGVNTKQTLIYVWARGFWRFVAAAARERVSG